jgi:rubrerythrin
MREDLEKLRPVRFSTDTISRKKAFEALNRECRCGAVIDHCGLETAMDIINELPPAQPESDSGRWERHYSRPGVYADLYWHCSKCGYKTDYQYANLNHRYCPNCGRKMEREVSDE